jgi:glycosyltransferase involved in cell wall biosynthesis
MKIGIVVWDLNISGGTQRQALELAKNLRVRGHEVVIYCVYYNKKTCYPELLSDLSVKYLIQTDSEKNDLKYSDSIDKEYSGILGLYKKVRELIKLFDSDLEILNIHDYLTYFVAPSFRKKYKKPVIWMMNDMPVDELRSEAKKTRLNSISLTLKRRFLKIFINKIDNIVVLDNWNKDKFKRAYGREANVIRSGLDVESYKFKRRCRSELLKIFTTGIFFPWRRFEDVIQALKFLKDKDVPFEFHHVGSDKRDMNYASKIYSLVEDLGLQKDVTFHGFVSENELIDLYSNSDVFIFPNYPQTWGLAVFEAMACGTPVICSTGSGAHEVLTDKENVLLVPPMSPDRITNCLIALYSDEELWNRLHKNGRIFVEKNITWEKYTSNMEHIFEESIRGYNG